MLIKTSFPGVNGSLDKKKVYDFALSIATDENNSTAISNLNQFWESHYETL